MDACRRMIHRRAAQQDPFVRPAGTNAGTFPAKLLRMRDTPRQLGFVGREPEMARLNGYLDQALAKGGGVCFVTGEPGAGKSSLLGEFTRRLQGTHPDIVFAVGDCNPQTGTVDPYLPFREIMGHLTGSAEAAADEAPARRGSPRFFAATARILQEHGPDLIDIFVPGAAVLTRLGAQAAGKMRARRGTGDGLAMEALFGSEPGPLAVHLARHFAEAGITERAIEFRVLAGQEARRAFANAEAIAHFEQALELLQAPDGTETAPTSPQPGQAGILTALGEVLLLDGAFEPARGKLERALRLTADDDGIARARLLRKVATTHEREHEHGQAMERLEQAAALLGEARDSGDTAVLHEWIAIQVSRLWLLYWQGDTDGMQAIVQDAEAIVERHANDTQKYRYYGAKTGLGNRLDRFAPSERTLEASQQALRAAQASTQILDHADGLFGTGFIHLLRNQLAEALELFTRSLELARRCGDRTLQARCLTYLVVLQRRAGQEHAVEALLPEARALCDSLRMAEYLAVLAACESWLAWRHDDFGAARQLAEQALALWEERAPRYPFKWLALLQSMAMDYREGRTDTALEAARALLTPPMARLAGGLEEALRAAVSDRDGQPDPADPARLGAAVECARAAGYL